MRPELLMAMREAEESEPAVRAAALLRIARVLTKIDQPEKSDYRDSFAHALRAFARDVRSNAAPRECWPSAEDFRTILYAAGRYDGAGGVRLIDRIPDPPLRLFARIEFAAGLARLEQLGGITREHAGSSIGS
jgi:hypothetical protein